MPVRLAFDFASPPQRFPPVNPVSKFKIPLRIFSWATFAMALALYWITSDPEVSYWDCPEYVVTASRLEIGHPPGNPLWMLAMRVATIPFPPASHAYVINLFSGLFMAFAAFFLCRIIFIPVRVYFLKSSLRLYYPPRLAGFVAGVVSAGASLCFAFCDSAWYSAVEAEVYAMSTFLSAASLWVLYLWWWEKSPGRRYRLIVLLCYLTGISLGVHQLNLLLIPVFSLAIFYRLHPSRVAPLRVFGVILGSCLTVGLILLAFIPGTLFGAQAFELLAVNRIGLPYNSGVIIFCLLLFLLSLIAFRLLSHPSTGYVSSYLFSSLTLFPFLLLGLSSFAAIMIRANAYPPMNEGVPDNIFSLAAYISRDQYPSSPLIYGNTPYSNPLLEETFLDGKPVYSRYILEKGKARYAPVIPGASFNHRSGMLSPEDSSANLKAMENGHGYVITDYDFSQRLTPELDMWLPRMTSRKVADRQAYADWAGMTEETMLRLPVSQTLDSLGRPVPRLDLHGERPPVFSYRPTYEQNLRFFISYQAYYMYYRYLFWNFIGRQNDYPSMGEIEHGNFITGFPFIDYYLGDTPEMPAEIWENNPGRNRYFGLPFIVGLFGILWLIGSGRISRRYLSLILLLFLMTGLAIVVYLNQNPGEPRERDYTFLVSYMAFTMWIAAGLLGLLKILTPKRFNPNTQHSKLSFWGIGMAGVISLGLPTLLALENFNDHDRRYRFQTPFFASSILDLEAPALIFSHGDNSTFPLWFLSSMRQSEGTSQDGDAPLPIDITYLSLPSYVVNLKHQGLSTLASSPQIAYGAFLLSRIPHDSVSAPMTLKEALTGLYSSGISDSSLPSFPSSKIIIPSAPGDSIVVNLHELSGGSSFLSFRHLMLLDLMASQMEAEEPKLLFFPYMIGSSFHKPLRSALRPALFGEIYAPLLTDSAAYSLLHTSVTRELSKLKSQSSKRPYLDPLISDRSARYRGEMLLAARTFVENSDTIFAREIIDGVLDVFPYDYIPPGNFTLSDSTFFEAHEALRLLRTLNHEYADTLDSMISSRRNEWIRYYRSLSPAQRSALSPRSRRLLL